MLELAIIADDLTGALDAAAPFAMRGITTRAALDMEGFNQALSSQPRVIAISTDSREISPERAQSRVADVIAALPAGIKLFKKVDSRLKGNIEAELSAIPHVRSVLLPAIPDFGRVVENGCVTGFGVATPISIAQVLGSHATRATIPDTASQEDIEAALTDDYDLLIGARGLANALAKTMSKTAPRAPEYPLHPAYVVIGSTDPITLAQVEHLRSTYSDLTYIGAPNGEAHPCGPAERPLTILQATPGAVHATGPEVAAALATSLGGLALNQNALLVLSGGATAQTILQGLGLHALELIGEALPGLPISRADGLTVVSKSGGFGDTDALVRLLSPSAYGVSSSHV